MGLEFVILTITMAVSFCAGWFLGKMIIKGAESVIKSFMQFWRQ